MALGTLGVAGGATDFTTAGFAAALGAYEVPSSILEKGARMIKPRNTGAAPRRASALNLVVSLGPVIPGPGLPSAETCVNLPLPLLGDVVNVGERPTLFILGEVPNAPV